MADCPLRDRETRSRRTPTRLRGWRLPTRRISARDNELAGHAGEDDETLTSRTRIAKQVRRGRRGVGARSVGDHRAARTATPHLPILDAPTSSRATVTRGTPCEARERALCSSVASTPLLSLGSSLRRRPLRPHAHSPAIGQTDTTSEKSRSTLAALLRPTESSERVLTAQQPLGSHGLPSPLSRPHTPETATTADRATHRVT